MSIIDKTKQNWIYDRDESVSLGLKLPMTLDNGYDASTKTTLEAVKQNVLNLIFKYLNIEKKKYASEHRKGLYFASIYENGREFLCNEIKEDALKTAVNFEVDAFTWWKGKAIKRYSKLHEENRLNGDTLWYDDLDSNNLKSWFSSRGIDELI